MKLIMGDGRTIRPLGIACNMNVKISRKCIPTDFFVIDAYHSNHDHIILGRPFLMLVDVVLDAGKGKVTMNLNGKKYTYNFFRVSKHPTPFPSEDEVEEVDSLCFVEAGHRVVRPFHQDLKEDEARHHAHAHIAFLRYRPREHGYSTGFSGPASYLWGNQRKLPHRVHQV
jgi:hypothetical protein